MKDFVVVAKVASVERADAAHYAQQCGFSRSVQAEDSNYGSLGEIQRD
jgi:hypothetical protein